MNPGVPKGKGEGSPAFHGSALPALAPEERRWLVAALGFALLTDLAHLLTWPLLPVDETRYLSVAWEMWLRHEWLVPHLNGALYTDKPPLLFWLVHLGWAVAGVNDVWPRMISGLAACAALWLTARLGRALWPQQAPASAAAWILATCGLWFVWTGLVMFDLLLTVFVLLGWNALVVPPLGRGRWFWWTMAVAGGMLTKGPVVLLFLLPPAVLVRWWDPAQQGLSWHFRWLAATVVGLALVLLWFVPAVLHAGWDYGRAIGLDQTAGRVVQSYAHRRPIGWYVPLIPLLTLPWSLWLPAYRRAEGTGAGAPDPGLRFLYTATIPAFVLLNCISGKQVHYLLPLFPALALVLARRAQQVGLRLSRAWPWAWTVLFLLPLAAWWAFQAVPLWQPWRDWAAGVPWWSPAAAAGIGCALGFLSRARPGPGIQHRALGAGLGLGLLCMGAGPTLREHFELEPLAREVQSLQQKNLPVAWVGRYQGELGFLGRLRQPLTTLRPDEVSDWARTHPDGLVLVPFKVKSGRVVPGHAGGFRVGEWIVELRRANELVGEQLKLSA